jgi:myo-inositol-1(or 4)-monophosphatase
VATPPSPPRGAARPTEPGARDTPEALAELARDVAVDTAAILREGLGRRRRIESKTTVTDLVTEMDRAAEAFIVERLLAARPDDGVLGEEGAARTGTSGVRWVIDPIDGTTNYVYGYPAFAVSIAAERQGTAVAGVVVNAAVDEVFSAFAGGGAHRDGEPIRCSEVTELHTALVATGFGYDAGRRARQADVLTTLLPLVRDIRRAGAASLDLCAVACGRVDAYYEKGLAPWDHAAGGLIAAEAGAIVTDLDGRPPTDSFVLATSPGLAEALRELLRTTGAADV